MIDQNHVDIQYKQLAEKILSEGRRKEDRTGTGTISIFGSEMKFNLLDGFPLLTTKKLHVKSIIHELLWFLNGDTNIRYLEQNGVSIWREWPYQIYKKNGGFLDEKSFAERIVEDETFADQHGRLGPVYGKQWRKWVSERQYKDVDTEIDIITILKEEKSIDQISNLINDLKNNPDSRRLMVSAWNPSDIPRMALPPCHYGFQCYTYEVSGEERINFWCKMLRKDISYGYKLDDEKLDALGAPRRVLDLKLNQRSVDFFLGEPYNIASYAILTHMLAKEVNMFPGELTCSNGDTHIYFNHVDYIKEQIQRTPYLLPHLEIVERSDRDIFSYRYDDFKIIDYVAHPNWKNVPIAV